MNNIHNCCVTGWSHATSETMGHWSTGDLGTGHTDAGTESISRHGEGGTKNNKDSDDGDARSNDGRLEQRNHGSGSAAARGWGQPAAAGSS